MHAKLRLMLGLAIIESNKLYISVIKMGVGSAANSEHAGY